MKRNTFELRFTTTMTTEKRNLLIATLKIVPPQNWEEFQSSVRIMGGTYNLQVGKFDHVHGPNCANIALECEGVLNDIESFAKQLSYILMPSKWTFTNDTVQGVFQEIKRD